MWLRNFHGTHALLIHHTGIIAIWEPHNYIGVLEITKKEKLFASLFYILAYVDSCNTLCSLQDS